VEFVLKELQDGLKYHLKQLEENTGKIKFHNEAAEDLKTRNETHRRAIDQIGFHIEQIKKTN
jgi:hypothetical protein